MSLVRHMAQVVRDVSALGFQFPIDTLGEVGGKPRYTVRVKGFGALEVRRKSSDLDVVRQIFSRREYDWSHLPQAASLHEAYEGLLAAGKTPLIIDAGANIGAASVWFASAFPRAAVIAVEPDAQNAELCRRNVAHLPQVKVVEAAIGSSDGSVVLDNPSQEAWGVRTVRGVEQGGGIPIVTIPSLAKSYQNSALFMVKVDIEGFEADLFAENTQWLADVKALFVEPHDWMLPGQFSSASMQAATQANRFELIIVGENLLFIH